MSDRINWPEGFLMKTVCDDCRTILPLIPDDSAQCVVTSPPYWGLRDYQVEGQIGLEETLHSYLGEMLAVFTEIRRVLHPTGTAWLNMGDKFTNENTPGGADPTIGRRNLGGGKYPKISKPYGYKPKDLIGLGWMLALMLQADGWWLRSEIIWEKPDCMPGSQKDRPTVSHEHLFLLTKSERYFYDWKAILEPYAKSSIERYNQDIDNQAGSQRAHGGNQRGGRPMKTVGRPHSPVAGWDKAPGYHSVLEHNKPKSHKGSKFDKGKTGVNQHRCSNKSREDNPNGRMKRTIWRMSSQPTKEAHFATFPEALVEPCILAGTKPGDIVLDPFHGSGTVGRVAERLGRKWIGIDLNPEYVKLANKRTSQTGLMI